MKVGSALVSGQLPSPGLAEAAVREAMARAGLSQAAAVFLFLTRDLTHCAKAAVVAAARVAGCLQVHGGTASGIFTEDGWLLDQPGAAALVLDHPLVASDEAATLLSLTGSGTLPHDWRSGQPRFGLLDSDASLWANGRLNDLRRIEIPLSGLRSYQSIVTGLRALSEPLRVEVAEGYDVRQIGAHSAADSLLRALPPGTQDNPPLHRMAVLRRPGEPGIPILSRNSDGSVTLGEPFNKGDSLIWCMRQTLLAEKFMREAMAVAVDAFPRPDFALMFSCIGRGPLFYGNDDLDLAAVRERYPGLPILGAYGSGQIAGSGDSNHLFQNTAMTLLLEASHV